MFAFRFGRQPTTLVFDPNNDIVIKQGTTTVGATLSTPTLVSPPNGSMAYALPQLTWNALVSAATYRVQVAQDSLFTAPVLDDSTVTDTSRSTTGSLVTNGLYYWRVSAKNGGGIGAWSPKWSFVLSLDNVAGHPTIPGEFSLSQNYPNPFNPTTVIRYGLPHRSHVTVQVFNVLGQSVGTLEDGEREAGYHDMVFDGKGLASGVYLYRIQADEFAQIRKLILMK